MGNSTLLILLSTPDITHLVQRRPHPVAVVRLEQPREHDLVAAAVWRREHSGRVHCSLIFVPD